MAHEEKRKYPRYSCSIDVNFDFFDGDPDEIDIETSIPEKGKGKIIDISSGGIFIISNSRVSPGLPIITRFEINKSEYSLKGKIVRTGLLQNNPTELAQKFSRYSAIGDAYIAVEFDSPLTNIDFAEIFRI